MRTVCLAPELFDRITSRTFCRIAETIRVMLLLINSVVAFIFRSATMTFLKLSVSGHVTAFVARTRRLCWSPPAPGKLLLGAVMGAQIVAAIIVAQALLDRHPQRWPAPARAPLIR
ncbi:MAG: hypothetical protein ABI563_05600 [Specibacter sp.]